MAEYSPRLQRELDSDAWCCLALLQYDISLLGLMVAYFSLLGC